MRILIDGYNLLFQSGLGGRSRSPGWIENARRLLLDFLGNRLNDQWASATVVVFDKSQGRRSQLDFHTAAGLAVKFAIEHPEADDLIEELINAHSAPKSLTVVSSDLRVKRRATARRASAVDSEQFLRQLEAGTFLQVASDASEPEDSDSDPPLSDHEVRFWMREFGDP